ncbi:MAG: response regulator [Desulforhopalus sp.]|nr:response regulator [Desulforhopalus sp.]
MKHMITSENLRNNEGTLLNSSEKQVILNALFESEAQKKAIFEGFCGILILFGQDMKAQWINKGVYQKYPDAIGKTCHEIFCSQTDKCGSCAFQKSLQSGKIESSTQRIGIFGRDGDETVFDITASPVKDRNDKVSGLIVIAQNVTEQYRLERQLRHTQKMEAIGTLAGGVAHDFNNVLTPIMGYTEIIRLKLRQDGFSDKAVYDYLEQILKASKRAKSLVEQVLTFSRSIEKKAVLQYMHPIVKEVMKLMRVTLPSTIVITEEVSEQCGRVLIDPVQIHQVLINLCTNAAHAMVGRHGMLKVKLDKVLPAGDGREWLELSVSDTGSGIEAELLDRIFEPYFSTKEKTSGTGMGLAMVHGIISRQGGRIDVESEIGKGSVFRVHLPVVQRETANEQAGALGNLQSGSGTILLVDDEEQVVQVTGEILQSLGYEIVGRTSPQDALQLFSSSPHDFDLVLTDLTMPGLTGLELSERMKGLRPDIPIILFTGYSDQVSKDAAVEAGINEYCMKPISMRDLSIVVGRFLGTDRETSHAALSTARFR